MNKPEQNGFTLVEIALALMVVGIGLLAVFGLFPTGLQMNKAVVDETQVALFAEQVLNGVRAQASTQRWDRIRTSINIPPPTPDVWLNPDDLTVRVTPGGEDNFQTLVYQTAGALGGGTAGYEDFGIRYRLEIRDVDARRKEVVLRIRPGQFGPVDPTYVFYTELLNHGLR
ncbi:MAG TPA: prepilin-type N-terminal cleavage/methylation domain-containing protein [Kiritimatiellia bacterium]|nr:prepilin-type N-terminal cleavage/methylation domain-containing protein [Kiritimatiellia bacterium]